MASPEGLAERSAPLLPPGSDVRHAFVCQTAPHFAFFIVNWATGLAMPWSKYRCVTVTDDAIYVLNGPRLSGGARPTSVIAALPRQTRLGPVSGRWGEITSMLDRAFPSRKAADGVGRKGVSTAASESVRSSARPV